MEKRIEQLEVKVEQLEAEIAALTGVVAVLIAALPASSAAQTRDRVHAQLENLLAVVLADSGPHSEAAVQAVQEMRSALLGDA